MLIMQSHIVRQEIEWAIIRERLWDRDGHIAWPGGLFQGRAVEDVVFGDEVARTRVQGAGQEGAKDEVYEGVWGGVRDEEVVKG